MHYALDPDDEHNSRIVDLKYAADSDGLVRYSAEVVIVKPTDLSRGNGALFYHVVNRGNFDNRLLSSAPWAEVASSPGGSKESLGRLMKQGFTIVFSGWQDDILEAGGEERLRLFAPEARIEGRPLEGEVLAEIGKETKEQFAYLGDGGHRAYAVDLDYEQEAEMRVHETYADPGTVIDRSRWSFARLEDGNPAPDSVWVYFPDGFEPLKIYTVRYRPNRSPVMGLCFPAVRDLVFFLSGSDTLNPLLDAGGECPVRYRLAYGSSQCGRYLRNFIYQGFNRAPDDTRLFDGVFANVPGCRMGFFNYRYAQPSRSHGFYPNFDFPFTDLPTTDPVTGRTGGILQDVPEKYCPRIFYTHHSGEYWSSGAAFTHVDIPGLQDVHIPPNVRIYLISGTAHGSAELVDGHPKETPQYLLPFNPNSAQYIEVPLIEALCRWVMFGEEPPPSTYPRLAQGELQALEEFSFPDVPDIQAPVLEELHPRFDWGPRFAEGILDKPLPGIGPLYPVLVPTVDQDGNEIAGIRSPHVAVPVASYTGWNYPALYQGAENTSASLLSGAWLPFASDRNERTARGDSRQSLTERYKGKDDYLNRLRRSAEKLVEQRLMFAGDVELILEEGGAMYDYVARNGAWKKESKPKPGAK